MHLCTWHAAKAHHRLIQDSSKNRVTLDDRDLICVVQNTNCLLLVISILEGVLGQWDHVDTQPPAMVVAMRVLSRALIHDQQPAHVQHTWRVCTETSPRRPRPTCHNLLADLTNLQLAATEKNSALETKARGMEGRPQEGVHQPALVMLLYDPMGVCVQADAPGPRAGCGIRPECGPPSLGAGL